MTNRGAPRARSSDGGGVNPRGCGAAHGRTARHRGRPGTIPADAGETVSCCHDELLSSRRTPTAFLASSISSDEPCAVGDGLHRSRMRSTSRCRRRGRPHRSREYAVAVVGVRRRARARRTRRRGRTKVATALSRSDRTLRKWRDDAQREGEPSSAEGGRSLRSSHIPSSSTISFLGQPRTLTA